MEGKKRNAVFCCVKCIKRSYRRANAERIAEYQREYYRANAERLSEYQREYLNNQSAAASTLYLAHTISQIRGDLTNGTHEPE